MNVFILSTGRCGSTTFVRACRHITNYTAAHESRISICGRGRFDYPHNHIEADNRLSWLIGRLDNAYGDDAFYVHLRRNDNDTATSFVRRFSYGKGIINAYLSSILLGYPGDRNLHELAIDLCDTINSNIELFLTNKPNHMNFSLENGKNDFAVFWKNIGAEGDLGAATLEFDIMHNATRSNQRVWHAIRFFDFKRFLRKLRRIVNKFPTFIRHA